MSLWTRYLLPLYYFIDFCPHNVVHLVSIITPGVRSPSAEQMCKLYLMAPFLICYLCPACFQQYKPSVPKCSVCRQFFVVGGLRVAARIAVLSPTSSDACQNRGLEELLAHASFREAATWQLRGTQGQQDEYHVVIMPTLLSLLALQVVVPTTCNASSDDKVGIMTTAHYNRTVVGDTGSNWDRFTEAKEN